MAVLDPFDYVSQGNWDGLRAALEAEPALAEARDENGLSLLIMSLYHRRTDVATLIESLRPAFDLFEASALGRAEDVARHLEEGADLAALTPDGFTALHLAAFFDRPDIAEKLLEAGAAADASAKNPSRVQPIHSAVAGKSSEVIAQLIEADVDLDAPQMGGWTALHAACKNGLEEIARALISGGADPLRRADDGKTPEDMLPEGVEAAAYGLGSD